MLHFVAITVHTNLESLQYCIVLKQNALSQDGEWHLLRALLCLGLGAAAAVEVLQAAPQAVTHVNEARVRGAESQRQPVVVPATGGHGANMTQ